MTGKERRWLLPKPALALQCKCNFFVLFFFLIFLFYLQMKQNRGDQAVARGEVHLSLPGSDPLGLSLQLGRDSTRKMGLAPSDLRDVSAASSAQAVMTWFSQGQCTMLGTKYQIPVLLLRDVPGSCSYAKHGHPLFPVPMGRASPATGPAA